MKKMWLTITACLVGGVLLSAAEPQTPAAPPPPPPADEAPWTFLQLSFGTDLPADAATTKVYGVKIGAPASGGPAPVYGVEGSVLLAGTEKVTGLQGSLITADAKEVTGIQLSLVNFSIRVAGVQIGIVNFAEDEAIQIGILNFIKNSSVPCLPVMNIRL